MNKILLSLLSLLLSLCALAPAHAAEGGIALDRFPTERLTDLSALQRGAKLFANYCLNCHSANYMRYNRMQEIGLSEQQIRDNLMFAGKKVGDPMTVTFDPVDAKNWLGAAPPDLSVIARSRAGPAGSGADYLYTFLRSFYRDDSTLTGWNNLAYPNTAMPHALWELQGQNKALFVQGKDPHDAARTVNAFNGFEPLSAGSMDQAQYNEAIADLVAYLQWMGEPNQGTRIRLGVFVLLCLGLFTVIAWRLNAAYWKDVK